MKLSAVGSTQAVLFEPENKRDAKWLSNYALNNEYMKTKQAKTNLGVAAGTLALSYLTMGLGTFAKKNSSKIATMILAFGSLATSIAFSIKNFVDKKKFKEGPEEQPQQTIEQATIDETTQA